MPWSETLPQVSLAGTLLTVLLLFFAAVGEPLLGRRAYAWLSRSRFDDERSLKLLHSVTMGVHFVWGLLVLLVVVLSPGLTGNDLGLRMPHAVGPVVAAAIGGLVALALFWVLVNGMPRREKVLPAKLAARLPEGKGKRKGRRAADRPMTLPEPGRRVEELLYPRTRAEQATAAGAAVTGGVFAEILYRGLFITLVASMGLNLFVAAVLSILLFSVAHVYQGWWGAAHGALTGTLFTVLYLGTGSLWVPIVVHVVLNIRSMVFPPASAAPDEDWYDDYGEYPEYDEYGDYHYDDYDEYGSDGRYGDTGEMEAVDAGSGHEGYTEPAGAGSPGEGPDGPRAGADSWSAGAAGVAGGPAGAESFGTPTGEPGPAGAGNAGAPAWGAAPPEPGAWGTGDPGDPRGPGGPNAPSGPGDLSDPRDPSGAPADTWAGSGPAPQDPYSPQDPYAQQWGNAEPRGPQGRPGHGSDPGPGVSGSQLPGGDWPGGAVPGTDAPSWRIDPTTGSYGSFGDHTSWESGAAWGSGEPSWGAAGPAGPAEPGTPDPNRWDYPTKDDPQAYWDMLDEPRGDAPEGRDGRDARRDWDARGGHP
ncbi:CPBP family glutamic-type intramembrane protease [Nocardiopsis coralli]|uniref:CPBP family glutamic-type intramembrane protease n=1 Tax=Nocardiopsis coralli TaxID=2772213 RepID=UPI002E2A6846|nr:CPBP family glutamic-type intramembrane protease [Nocardiopsis coralli]